MFYKGYYGSWCTLYKYLLFLLYSEGLSLCIDKFRIVYFDLHNVGVKGSKKHLLNMFVHDMNHC